jgi:hypothetical protein
MLLELSAAPPSVYFPVLESITGINSFQIISIYMVSIRKYLVQFSLEYFTLSYPI